MKLVRPEAIHIKEMMSWINSEEELETWAGPSVRYPFDFNSIAEDLSLESLASFCLISDDAALMAFGQYYNRLDCCHLGRLLVAPDHRGKGIVEELIKQISALGLKELELDSLSLFVVTDNTRAIKAYEKFGFKISEYPEEIPMENCLYMVKVLDH